MKLNVVVAPRLPGLAVRSVLKDWSALGLVSEVFWITAEAADAGGAVPLDPSGPRPRMVGGIRAARIAEGVAHAVDLQAVLAREGRLTQARICVLDPMTGPSSGVGGTAHPSPGAGDASRELLGAQPARRQPGGTELGRTGDGAGTGTGSGGGGTGAGSGAGGTGVGPGAGGTGAGPGAGGTGAGPGAGDGGRTGLVALGSRVGDLVTAAAPGVPQRLVHVLATTLEQPGTVRPAVLQGWHGVLIAPQDAQSPLAPRRQVRAADDPHDVATHLASGLAGVLGLWQGFDETPVDQLRAGPADQVRLAQSYLQARDAAVFGGRLRAALTEVYPDLPAPVAEHRPLPRVQDVPGATTAAADALFGLHDWVLRREREVAPAHSAQQIGIGQAIAMFFGFLWGALRSSPQQWWQRLVGRGSRKLAAVTQNTVFGADSEYDVVVRGWLPNGQLATPAQVDDAARVILRRLGAAERHEEATVTFPELWRDLHGIALDLADAGGRVAAVPAPHYAGQPAVVGSAAAIAPGPWEAFTDIPPHLATALGVREISASDLRMTELVTQRLEQIMTQRGDLALEANATRSAMLAWSQRTQQASFAGRVGGRLAAAQSELRQEIGTIRHSLAGLEAAVSPDDGFADQQRRWSRRARWLLWIGVAVVGALLLAWNRAWLSGGTAVRWIAVVVVVELIAQLYLFFRGQQALFHLLHRQQQLEDEAAVGVRNLTAALTDLHRVDAASRQLVPVAEVLGSFVAQPLGVPLPVPAGIDVPADRLPESLKIGAVRADDGALQRLLQPLRFRLFAVGWLEEPYRRFLAGADAFDQATAQVGRDPGRLLAAPAASGDAPLRRWTAHLRTSGTPASLGDEIWGRALQLVASPEFVAEAGVTDLPTVWAGGQAPVHGMGAGLDRPSADAAQFDTAILAPGARSGRGRLVDPAAVLARSRFDGLSRSDLLVALGQPFDAVDLDVAAPTPTAAAAANPVQGPRF